jgi:hypothetical protein
MRATFLIYSGRPNPTWTIPEPLAEEIRRAIAAMPEAPGPAPPEGGLGYSGVLVEGEGEGGQALSHVFAAGLATAGDKAFRDPGRRIERMLLASGGGRVPGIEGLT